MIDSMKLFADKSGAIKEEPAGRGKNNAKGRPKTVNYGVWGDPRKATKKDGNKILNEIIENLSKKCQTYLTDSRS